MVELADTLDLGSSARAWGFKSLQAHQNEKDGFLPSFFVICTNEEGLEPERAAASMEASGGRWNSRVFKAAAGRSRRRTAERFEPLCESPSRRTTFHRSEQNAPVFVFSRKVSNADIRTQPSWFKPSIMFTNSFFYDIIYSEETESEGAE